MGQLSLITGSAQVSALLISFLLFLSHSRLEREMCYWLCGGFNQLCSCFFTDCILTSHLRTILPLPLFLQHGNYSIEVLWPRFACTHTVLSDTSDKSTGTHNSCSFNNYQQPPNLRVQSPFLVHSCNSPHFLIYALPLWLFLFSPISV